MGSNVKACHWCKVLRVFGLLEDSSKVGCMGRVCELVKGIRSGLQEPSFPLLIIPYFNIKERPPYSSSLH